MNERFDKANSETRLGAALRAAPETTEQPSAGLHERIMSAVRQEPRQERREDAPRAMLGVFLRPVLALAAVGALAGGVTLAVVASREDQSRAEEARAFVRVTQNLAESARTLEQRVLDRASELLIDPVERQARALEGDAKALLVRMREAFPDRSGLDG